jgi:hypothetical protein
VGKNIARVNALAAQGQALVDALCTQSAHRVFNGPASASAVFVIPFDGGNVGQAIRASLAPANNATQEQPNKGSYVVWNTGTAIVYFAPTGSAARSEHLGDARRGNAEDLIRFNLQARPWLTRQLGTDVIPPAPEHDSRIDPGASSPNDVIEILAAHCIGAVFNAPDHSSTVTAFRVSDAEQEHGGREPVVMWTDKSGKEGTKVYFAPPGSTPGAHVMELMGARQGSEEDLRALASGVLPWLEPEVEKLAGGYLEGWVDRALAV